MVNHTSKDNESFIELQVENEMRRNIGRRMRGRGGASLDKVSVELEKLHCRLVQLRLEEVTGEEGGHGHLLSGGNIQTAHHLDSSAGCNATR